MRRDRRKKTIRIFEVAAIGVVLLDVAVYLLAVLPLKREVDRGETSYHRVLLRLQQRQQNVVRLENFQKALPAADDHLKAFIRDHVPPRRLVFSDAARLVRVLTQQSGVQLDSVSYKLSSEKGEPLDRLGLDITVEGPFPSLLKFAHSLETADDLILVRNFTFAARQSGSVTLRVGGVLFLTP
ncbi:MAG: GspMb/PilO family protein [Acidobacteriota bacterium]